MAIDGVAFDLEGTLTGRDVEGAHFEGFRLAAAEIGVMFDPNNPVEDIARKIENAIGGGDILISEGISGLSGGKVSGADIRERKMYFYNLIIEGFETIEPRPGFLGVLEQIHRLELPVAIGSSTPTEQARVLLKKSDLYLHFDSHLIVLREDVKNSKPAPDVYLETARRMGIAPTEQLVFEDSATGISAAKAAGCIPIAIPVYWHTASKLLKAGALRIFRDWRDINMCGLIEAINAQVER